MNLNDVVYYNNRELGKAVYFTDASVLVQDAEGKLALWSRIDALNQQEYEEAEARNALVYVLRKSKLSAEAYKQLASLVENMNKL